MENREKLIIIGGGPAGLTAAIYAGRAGLDPLVIMGPEPGGQITLTSELENYPGFPEGVTGFDLMQKMIEQAEKFSARKSHIRLILMRQVIQQNQLLLLQVHHRADWV